MINVAKYLKLEKSRKDDIEALGPHADWATKVLKHNGVPHNGHLNWVANAARKEPASLTPENKTKIEHFAGMYHLPQVHKANLNGQTIEQGLKTLQAAQTTGQVAQAKSGLVSPKGHVLQQTKTGKAWHNLEVAGDEEEGAAGHHCGNMPAYKTGRDHEKIISLREPTKVPTQLRQHLTFISNEGHITESKGRGNQKAGPEYHSDILDLLDNPHVKSVVGGGYASGSNFDPEDITDPELRARLDKILERKPNLFNPDLSELHETVQQDPFLSFAVTDKHGLRQHEEPDPLPDYKNMDPIFQRHILNNQTVPEWKVGQNGRKVRMPDAHTLAAHPDIHPSMQEEIMNGSNEHLKDTLFKNPNIRPDLFDRWTGDNTPVGYRQNAASNPTISPAIQQRLFNQNNSWIKIGLAKNKNLSLDIQHALVVNSGTNNYITLRELAKNPNTDPSVQKRLMEKIKKGFNPYSHERLLQDLGDNPNLDPSLRPQLIAELKQQVDAGNVPAQEWDGDPEDDPHHDAVGHALDAMDSLQNIRKHTLIDQLKDDETHPDILKRYEFSHDPTVAKAAQENLARRKAGLAKSQQLQKGALRLRAPFNPHEEKGLETTVDWVSGNDTQAREDLLPTTGAGRKRGLNKLRSVTQTRKNPRTGGIEYLLHRGMGNKEANLHQQGGEAHDTMSIKTSWTPHKSVAHEFAHEYTMHGDESTGHVISAWIPEHKIHSMPYMFGNDPHVHEFRNEHEVVVAPHTLNIHSIQKQKQAQKERDQQILVRDLSLKDVSTHTGKAGVKEKVRQNLEVPIKRNPLKKTMGQGIPHVASIAVIDPSTNTILMGQRTDTQKWTLPGGHLEDGETPFQGAIRELKEESGVSGQNMKYLGTKQLMCEDGQERVIHSFIMEGRPKTTGRFDPDEEVQKWKWVPFSNGLPETVKNNLHSRKNVTLKFLGIQE